LIYAASINRNTVNPANKHIDETKKYAKEYGLELNSIIKLQPYNSPPPTFADTKNQIKELMQIEWQTHWLKQNTKLRKIKNTIFSSLTRL